ncbi:hypothetical protein [Martelella soudanensis]|uniref:hypothetical protein n=1 Tax=unclassified Martelella TaxID=2629616 RepID=UPI0015DED53D|nr:MULTISPECIES: hypothetical protein [unclassified Martelella]
MPQLAEVLFYMRGLWLLFRADPAHARHLDFTDRGVARSFWALAYSFPLMVASELVSLTRLMQPAVDLTLTALVRTALIQGLSWMAPLVVLGVVCMVSGLPRAFLKIIVATNWLSLPVNIFAALAIFLIATGLQPLASIVLVVFQTVLLGAFLFEIRIVYMLLNEKVLPTAAAIIASAITALLVTDIGTRYIIGG